MEYGLIGERLTHSFSKEIHSFLGSYDYTLREISKDALPDFLKERRFRGINVTLPYKESVIPYLDGLSNTADRIGAVNTVINQNGKLIGYNTDYDGLKKLILKNTDPVGKNVLILGSGGTSKTALAVFEDLGAKKCCCVSRAGKIGCKTYEQAIAQASDFDIIVNTTPCGMYPNNGQKPIDIKPFSKLSCVLDAIYNPLRTELVLDAREAGIKSLGGLYMLIAQAVSAAELFMGVRAHEENRADDIYEKTVCRMENIVLVGMPGCGKTTVGKIIADITGREFIDTDSLIEKHSGCTISEFFDKKGENAFRDAEETVICEHAAKRTGVVISTGGGAILRDKNVRALKANGKIVFIERPVDELLPTENRPLAKSRNDLTKLYAERYEKYRACADVCVTSRETPEATAKSLLEKLF